MAQGDVILGLASSGFHSNGYSLVRKVLEVGGLSLEDHFKASSAVGVQPGQTADDRAASDARELERSVGELVLEPTRIYVRSVLELLDAGVSVKAMAHITGGGMPGNLSRVMPEGLSARLDFSEWQVPAVFRAVQTLGHVPEHDMFATFNMGIGFVLVVPAAAAAEATERLRAAGERVVRLGEVGAGGPRVVLTGVTMEDSA